MLYFNRRRFLQISTASLGFALLSKCAFAKTKTKQNISALTKIYYSINGLLEVNLDASNQNINIAGKSAYFMTYNGQIPAPRLEVKPGDTVRIHFQNNLDQPTNLHFHGLHIPPTGNADNIFLDISPGENLTYEFTIPNNHPAGIFWYHPHRHGLVAEQVFAGLAGLLIVRGDLDQIPEVKAAKEEFLVLQDFDLTNNGRIFTHNPMTMMLGREGNVITINGETQPNFNIPNNGLLRLRLLNASPSRFYRLSLENHPLYLIATDQGSLNQPVELNEILLTPGERADILIKGEQKPSTYKLLNLPYDRGSIGMMGGGGMMGRGRMGGGMMGSDFNNNTPEILATFNYLDSQTEVALPTQLIPRESLPQPEIVRRFDLSHSMMPGQGMVFLINGKTYDHNRIDTEVKLNTIEDWEITNLSPLAHPFHLHINPFQIISRNGIDEPYVMWKDTVLINPGETVRIRIHFQDFTGKTVYHCHIFDHEDLGMMGILELKT